MSKKETKTVDMQLERVTESQKFVKSLQGLTKEQLEAKEQELIKEADKVNNDVINAKFDLKQDGYAEACYAIRFILSHVEVQWQYAKAMTEMYDFWDGTKKPDYVNFGMLDTTLRQLGQLKFTGYEEWKAVVDINSYFESIKDKYIETSQKIYDVADKHQAIMQELDKIEGKAKLERPLVEDGDGGKPSQVG